MTQPTLVPIPPTPGQPAPVSTSPFWIGAGETCPVRLFLPGLADRHTGIVQRQDGYWVMAAPGASPPPSLNGVPITSDQRLGHGDVIEVAPGARYQYDSGEPQPQPVEEEPEFVPLAPTKVKRKRRKRRKARRRGMSVGAKLAIAAIVLLVVAAIVLVVFAFRQSSEVEPLSEAEAAVYDSLMVLSYENLERGTVLLGMGAGDEALAEFARAVTYLETSALRNNPWIKPRIQELEATIAESYRAKQLAVPTAYRSARRTEERLSTHMAYAMSVEQFALRLGELQERFRTKYGREIVVTGSDHDEHVSLYGPGSAVDLRVLDLERQHIAFAVAQARSLGIRVKDFSQDAVLQAQIQRAVQAGQRDRAGTGLHLHLDRMVARYDRYTVD